MSKTSSSSRSTSYVTSQGAGASSSASTTSPLADILLQDAIFVPGATSASASASANNGTASVAVSADSPTANGDGWEQNLNPVFHMGSQFNDLFQATDQQDVMIGYGGADIFELSINGRETTVDTADIIIDFDTNEDFLQLPAEITADDLYFEVTDADTVAASTVIRLGETGDILAVVFNRILPIASLQNPPIDSGASSRSSSKSFVTDAGAGTITEATATSPDGKTVRSVDSLFVPGATSSGGGGSAIATPDQLNATVNLVTPVQYPDANPALSEPESVPVDFILGTAMEDTLVSDSGRDVLIGYDGGDIFVLDTAGAEDFSSADLILDFNVAAGDLVQFSSELSPEETIVLEGVDLDNDLIPESTSIQLTNGDILAIAYGSVDLLTNPLLAIEMFTTVA